MRNTPHERLTVLDGMRGLAALFVVIHHAGPMAAGRALLPRGYLAVDFFFMLSGFVLCRTYEGRLQGDLTFRAFVNLRIRRLYPVMALGIVLGASHTVMVGWPLSAVATQMILGLLFIPLLGDRNLGVFRLNGPQWSLLFELMANFAHAALFRRMRSSALVILALITLGLLMDVGQRFGSLAVGDLGRNFLGGIPRVLFSYLVGILLGCMDRRLGQAASAGHGGVLILMLGMLLVSIGLIPRDWDGWWVDIATVALAFPALVMLGARSRLSVAASRRAEAAGALSYPLYALHIPVMSIAVFRFSPLLNKGMPLLILALMITVASSHFVRRLTARNRMEPVRKAELASAGRIFGRRDRPSPVLTHPATNGSVGRGSMRAGKAASEGPSLSRTAPPGYPRVG